LIEVTIVLAVYLLTGASKSQRWSFTEILLDVPLYIRTKIITENRVAE